jgi:hypothetical protein
MISKKLLNIILKRLKVQIIVWLNSKQGLPIRISDSRSKGDNGILHRNQDLKVFSIKESYNCISTLKSLSSEFDSFSAFMVKNNKFYI